MIKAILFDADGVIVNKPKMFSEILQETYSVPVEAFVRFYKAEFSNLLVGKGDLKAVFPKYLQEWNVDKTPEELLEFWFESEHYIDEAMVAEVTLLKQKGIQCFIGTNQEKYRTDYMKDQMGFKNIFDSVFSSAYLGAKKPDHAFFEKILIQTSLQKDEIFFWDDDQENIEGAIEFGIQSQLYTNLDSFKQTMSTLLN